MRPYSGLVYVDTLFEARGNGVTGLRPEDDVVRDHADDHPVLLPKVLHAGIDPVRGDIALDDRLRVGPDRLVVYHRRSPLDRRVTPAQRRGILKKCVNSQAVYPLSEQHGLKARERRYTAHEEGKHWE